VVCIRSEVVYCTGPPQEEIGQMKSQTLLIWTRLGGGPFKGLLAVGHWRGMACSGE
jgi:hypothetical protein